MTRVHPKTFYEAGPATGRPSGAPPFRPPRSGHPGVTRFHNRDLG